MTVSIIQQDMTADERPESRYDCVSCFLDRQLQNKLLEHDEVLEANELFAKLNGSNEVKNVTPKALMSKAESITGWITDSKLVLRKPDKESNSNTSNKNLNGYQQWKDNRNKLNGQESYVFKHYCDTHGYIEQYRRDHTNVFIYKSPTSIQNMQGEGVQRYGQQINNTPAQITSQQNANICNHCNVSNAVPNYISTSLHYTNRCNTILGNGAPYAHSQYSGSGYQVSHTSAHQNQNSQSGGSHRPSAHGSHSGSSHHRQHQHSSACKKHKHHVDSASQAFKYKLAPETYWGNTTTRSDSQNSSESEKTLTSASAEMKTPRIGSGKGGKSPTKVTVPSIQNQLQNVSVAWRLPRQNTQIRTQDNTSTPMRTLDTLACVAADKQYLKRARPLSTSTSQTVRTLGHILMDASALVRGRTVLRPATVSSTALLCGGQMWFDSSGRAYVSLAARYDPHRK